MMTRHFKTAKGTDLPLLNLNGKQYLEVKFRLVWFRFVKNIQTGQLKLNLFL